MLGRDGRPSPLGTAFAEYGRAAKTLHLLAMCDTDDETYRRTVHTQLTVQESRHRLARKIFHGQRGELRQRFALTGAKADEREVLLELIATDPALNQHPPGQILLADRNYYGRAFEAELTGAGLELLRRARKGEPERPGGRFFKPLRQTVESIFATLKGQLDLERHGGHTPTGATVRVLQRLLALTAAIWHNDHTGQTVKRSLLAYDH